MKLSEIVVELNLKVHTGANALDIEVTGGYASDLLSDVMGNAEEGRVWVTLQAHQNIVAVAVLVSLAGIILVNGREPDEATIKKAMAEEMPIMTSDRPAFELAGQLYQLGLKGE